MYELRTIIIVYQIEIYVCSRNIAIKMNTFVDLILLWIQLPRPKKFENSILPNKSNHYFTFSNIAIQIYAIRQSNSKKCPAF